MRHRLAIALIATALIGGQAAAQDGATVPAMGSAATDAQSQPPADQADQTFHILAIGDALGGGLGAGLIRRTESSPGYDVTLRFNELSGLARPELYDWSETVPKLVEGKHFDAIVMLIGENDRQEIRNGTVLLPFGSDSWTAAYQAQLDKVIAALKATGSAVYWVSLPPMADPGYESAMQKIMDLQKAKVIAAGLHFVDIRSAFLDADGKYTDRGPDDTGTVRSLRGRDGVSFYKAGNNRMGQLVLAAIEADRAKPAATPVQPQATATTTPSAPIAAPAAPVSSNPLFGGTGGDGAEITFRADAVVVASSGAAKLSAVQALTPPGSAAADLLIRGVAGPAPPGRADDFTMTAK